LPVGGIAEHFEEDGLGEFFQLSEGFAALAPQFLNLIQRRRDPSLLR